MQYSTKAVDHLGLIAGMVDELGIVDVIDNAIEQDMKKRHLSIGQVVKAMILNGLGFTSRPIYLTPQFFQTKALDILIGKDVKPSHLNDNTIGRALDSLYTHGVSALFSLVCAQAYKALHLKSRYLHLDSTSFKVYGNDYAPNKKYDSDDENEERPGVIEVTRGYSKDHRPDLLQVMLNITVENSAGIPMAMEAMNVVEDADETVEEIVSVHYKKDLAELQWIENLCKWADKLGLDEKKFPRKRAGLEELRELNLSNKGIDALPEELTKLQNLEFLFLCDNNLETIPSWISKFKKLRALHLSNNKISTLPKEIFDIKTLADFCLHGNRLTTLPEEIGNLTNLMQLSISNNDISELPHSIVNLKRIRSLQIENTPIEHIPAEFLENIHPDILSINDELLPKVAKKIITSNIDTINLTASKYVDSSQIVRSLNLYVDEDEWMEAKDKTDKGYVLLKKDPIRSAVEIAKKIADEKL